MLLNLERASDKLSNSHVSIFSRRASNFIDRDSAGRLRSSTPVIRAIKTRASTTPLCLFREFISRPRIRFRLIVINPKIIHLSLATCGSQSKCRTFARFHNFSTTFPGFPRHPKVPFDHCCKTISAHDDATALAGIDRATGLPPWRGTGTLISKSLSSRSRPGSQVETRANRRRATWLVRRTQLAVPCDSE